jgi:hypothetical protein
MALFLKKISLSAHCCFFALFIGRIPLLNLNHLKISEQHLFVAPINVFCGYYPNLESTHIEPGSAIVDTTKTCYWTTATHSVVTM